MKTPLRSAVAGIFAWRLCQTHSFPTQRIQTPTFADLQRCITPEDMLQKVGAHLPCGSSQEGVLLLSSTLLVRLSKRVITLDNQHKYSFEATQNSDVPYQSWSWDPLQNVVESFLSSGSWSTSPKLIEAAVDGLKAAAVLARLCPNLPTSYWTPLIHRWQQETPNSLVEDYHLSGIKWSMDCFQCAGIEDASLSPSLQLAYDALNLPFCVRPGALSELNDLNLWNLLNQVEFQVDTIKTSSNKIVQERRQTAWEGDDSVAPFEYSGKSMPRRPWSPVVEAARDVLHDQTGVYYDGCLLNHYPDGGSGMRYHIDPDQGTLWDFSTAVVSVGATRKFAFRETTGSKPHVFTLLQGDCTEMFGDCQSRYQHTVKTAETPHEQAARASLVFKKTL